MINETNNFSFAIDKLGSSKLGKPALRTLTFLSFLAPEKIPEFFLVEMVLSVIFETQNKTADFEYFQEKIIRKLKKKDLINYDESDDSFTIPSAVREAIQNRESFAERKKILHLTYFSLSEFFGSENDFETDEEKENFEENYDLYIRHILHALKYNEEFRHECEHSATLFFVVGRHAVKNKKYAEAAGFYEQAVAITESKFKISNTVANYKSHLGNVYRLQEKYADSIEIYKESLSLNKQLFGDESGEYADGLFYLARALSSSGDYAKAVGLFGQAIEIQTKILDENSSDLMFSFYHLAIAYSEQGNFNDALVLFEKVLKIAEKAEIDNTVLFERLHKYIENCREKLAG